ncbi:MAG: UvrB/UvrC motif-containing protein [Akkermansia sp.]|nr:UvrB/UvrC motif-containing protein [Akkermansia sp.]
MKKCQICGKRASIFLTQIINGQATDLALCESCARERGLFDPQSLTFAEKFFPEAFRKRVDKLVRELISESETPAEHTPAAHNGADLLTQCPTCGYTLQNYRNCSRLGCTDCYSVFEHEISEMAPPDTNEADIPPMHETDESIPLQRSRLEQQLQAAVEREDYETAAALRDRIKNLH